MSNPEAQKEVIDPESSEPDNPSAVKAREENTEDEELERKDSDGAATPESAEVIKSEEGSRLVYIKEIWDADNGRWDRVDPDKKPSSDKIPSRCVIVVRWRYKRQTGEDEGDATVVDIRAGLLREIFRFIFRAATSFTLNDVNPRFFFWARPRLQRLERHLDKREDLAEALDQVRAAIEFCDSHFANIAEDPDGGRITYDGLWTLFAPGALVTGLDILGQDRVWEVVSTIYRSASLLERRLCEVNVRFIEFNGNDYGWAHAVIKINPFAGARPLEDLEIRPLHSLNNRIRIKDNILQRAKKQQQLLAHEFVLKHYSGYGTILNEESDDRDLARLHFVGKVMIDPRKTVEKYPDDLMPPIRLASDLHYGRPELVLDEPDGKQFAIEEITQVIEKWGAQEHPETTHRTSTAQTDAITAIRALSRRQRERSFRLQTKIENQTKQQLSDHQALLLSGLVYGYSMTKDTWGAFSVSQFSDVDWSESAFDALVMDPDLKSQLGRLVQAYGKQKPPVDDFIKSKGRGLIGVLHGSPGLGKTFTAEAIAEMANLPLMPISAGTLGVSPSNIERNLRNVLELAARWRAVVLLDEADVFLARREARSIEHNAVVSVFLRELEYFPGIMLLTTNQVNAIDPAFQSRIHFCHHYPELDRSARQKIWKEFLSQAERSRVMRVNVRSSGYEQLAAMEYNGRQIKNIMSMASMLATNETPAVITTKQILSVARTMQNWDDENASSMKRHIKSTTGVSNTRGTSRFSPRLTNGRKNDTHAATALYSVVWVLMSLIAIVVLGRSVGRIM